MAVAKSRILKFHAKGAKEIRKEITMNENDLSYKIMGVALELHKSLGPGLLESVYETALAYDLGEVGLKCKTTNRTAIFL